MIAEKHQTGEAVINESAAEDAPVRLPQRRRRVSPKSKRYLFVKSGKDLHKNPRKRGHAPAPAPDHEIEERSLLHLNDRSQINHYF